MKLNEKLCHCIKTDDTQTKSKKREETNGDKWNLMTIHEIQ